MATVAVPAPNARRCSDNAPQCVAAVITKVLHATEPNGDLEEKNLQGSGEFAPRAEGGNRGRRPRRGWSKRGSQYCQTVETIASGEAKCIGAYLGGTPSEKVKKEKKKKKYLWGQNRWKDVAKKKKSFFIIMYSPI